ncbi:MAG TPA: hypothetical protein VD862_03170 [Candidatus Paceibacterota bacterium]|nr:hypothetical protein [Candidatus Paceibacterota bacterium]
MTRTERIVAVAGVAILFGYSFAMSPEGSGVLGRTLEAAVVTLFWVSLFLIGATLNSRRPWKTRLFRIAVLAVLNYPIVVMLVLNTPGLISDYWTPTLSAEQALQAVLRERKTLGIPEKTVIGLKLVNGPAGAETWWSYADGPFTVIMSKSSVREHVIRHEMYHVARIMRCRWEVPPGQLAAAAYRLRYLYLEEPLAVVYQATRVQLGFCE